MKTRDNNPDTLLLILMHFSIFFILSLALVNVPSVKGQMTYLPGQKLIHSEQQKVQQIYTSQIGIREKGTNSGPAVEQYLRYVNLPKGNPWCAAFVCWVFGQAGIENPRTGWSPGLFGDGNVIWNKEPRTRSQEPGFPPSVQIAYSSKPATGNSQLEREVESRTRSRESRLLYGVPYGYSSSLTTNNEQLATPSASDIFALYFPEKKRIAHTGFIDQWDGTWLITVEGNTNVSGSREGDGVYRKRRLVRTVYQMARYIGFRE